MQNGSCSRFCSMKRSEIKNCEWTTATHTKVYFEIRKRTESTWFRCEIHFHATWRADSNWSYFEKKNDDDDSSFSRERKQRTGENERETKILYLCERNNKYGRDDCCVYILLHMMAVEVVNVVACCSDHTYTNRNRTNEVHRGMCVWRECAANVVDYKYVR